MKDPAGPVCLILYLARTLPTPSTDRDIGVLATTATALFVVLIVVVVAAVALNVFVDQSNMSIVSENRPLTFIFENVLNTNLAGFKIEDVPLTSTVIGATS